MSHKLLSLDLSTYTGWSIFEDGKLTGTGLIEVKVEGFNVNDRPEKHGAYPKNIIDAAWLMSCKIQELYSIHDIDEIVIENTVKGRNRHTQRLLEFIHKDVLGIIIADKIPFTYLDPSEWRYLLDMRLSTEDKKNNKDVSKKLKRGKITKKHLSVRMANEMFGLKLKLKDNDIADSILLGAAYLKRKNEGIVC